MKQLNVLKNTYVNLVNVLEIVAKALNNCGDQLSKWMNTEIACIGISQAHMQQESWDCKKETYVPFAMVIDLVVVVLDGNLTNIFFESVKHVLNFVYLFGD